MAAAKYIVGIDLGTTNMVLSYSRIISGSDNEADDGEAINYLLIAQEQPKNAVDTSEVLPAFIFERLKEKPVLPWNSDNDFIIGEFARERGAEVPDRVISSAKSWLCNTRVDRTKAILPFNGEDSAKKISPLQAMAMFISHLKNAWLQEFPKDKLENQKVIVTIPASFDAAARDLVVEAAKMAGLSSVSLIEEPQAAFYSWISQKENPWRRQVKKGDVVLVVDVGGGTTDFSLIEITESDGELNLDRVAVGSHILLGGDNMDLTLAYIAAKRLEDTGKKISRWQTVQLSHQCRKAKEILLSDSEKDSVPVTVSGRGSSVIGGTIKTQITREDVENNIVEGFFPHCSINDEPAEDTASGVRELNLMYAADAAVSKHLAKFLKNQMNDAHKEYGYPNAILFNGGVFKAKIFRDRLVAIIDSWLTESGKDQIKVLEGIELSKAVSRGAVYFGQAVSGKGIRIRGGVSQSYYLGIETPMPAVPGFKPPLKALCVAKQGTEEGSVLKVENQSFGLVIGKTAEFRFFKSNCRREDEFGQLIPDMDESFEETSLMTAEMPAYDGLKAGDLVDVELEVVITEIGTLEVYCISKDNEHRWRLEFNVREAA